MKAFSTLSDRLYKKNFSLVGSFQNMIPPVSQFDLQTVVLPHTTCQKNMVNRQVQNGNSASHEIIQNEVSSDISERGLIVPKKPHNPCLESPEHQHLRKELLFNNKM